MCWCLGGDLLLGICGRLFRCVWLVEFLCLGSILLLSVLSRQILLGRLGVLECTCSCLGVPDRSLRYPLFISHLNVLKGSTHFMV